MVRASYREYESHSGESTYCSLKMRDGGRCITLRFLSVEPAEYEQYRYDNKEIFDKHPAWQELEAEHEL